jgi:far upstream element-binding protein
VIGKGGETIKRLSEQYGVKLVVVQETSAATSGDKPLRITGEPDKVAKAKEAVLEMLNPSTGPAARFQTNDYGSKAQYGGGGGGGSGGATEVFIKVPGDKAGIVIGKGN